MKESCDDTYSNRLDGSSPRDLCAWCRWASEVTDPWQPLHVKALTRFQYDSARCTSLSPDVRLDKPTSLAEKIELGTPRPRLVQDLSAQEVQTALQFYMNLLRFTQTVRFRSLGSRLCNSAT